MGVHRVKTTKELVAIAISNPTPWNRKRARESLAKDEAKKEIKEDFEKYLNEEREKCSLGFNPYQE